jgi:hypothetical protein
MLSIRYMQSIVLPSEIVSLLLLDVQARGCTSSRNSFDLEDWFTIHTIFLFFHLFVSENPVAGTC